MKTKVYDLTNAEKFALLCKQIEAHKSKKSGDPERRKIAKQVFETKSFIPRYFELPFGVLADLYAISVKPE